jgi:hypothetical protein
MRPLIMKHEKVRHEGNPSMMGTRGIAEENA